MLQKCNEMVTKKLVQHFEIKNLATQHDLANRRQKERNIEIERQLDRQ